MANWLRKSVFLDPAAVSEEMIDVFATCAQQPAAEHAALAWLRGALGMDLEAQLRIVSQPTALLWGEERGPEPDGRALPLQRLLPAASVMLVSGGGILAALEAPAAMVAAIEEQLGNDWRVLKAG